MERETAADPIAEDLASGRRGAEPRGRKSRYQSTGRCAAPPGGMFEPTRTPEADLLGEDGLNPPPRTTTWEVGTRADFRRRVVRHGVLNEWTRPRRRERRRR